MFVLVLVLVFGWIRDGDGYRRKTIAGEESLYQKAAWRGLWREMMQSVCNSCFFEKAT